MERVSRGGVVELRLEVDSKVYEEVDKLAKGLGSSVANLIIAVLDVLADYSNDIVSLGRELAISEDKRVISALEELVYYGVESWRNIVNPLLDYLKARGCYELESLDFEPLEPLIEIEMIALEGCKYKVDKLILTWSAKGISLEAYYYLEDGIKPSPSTTLTYEWSYIPDENAIVISIIASTITQVPPLDSIEKELEKLGV